MKAKEGIQVQQGFRVHLHKFHLKVKVIYHDFISYDLLHKIIFHIIIIISCSAASLGLYLSAVSLNVPSGYRTPHPNFEIFENKGGRYFLVFVFYLRLGYIRFPRRVRDQD